MTAPDVVYAVKRVHQITGIETWWSGNGWVRPWNLRDTFVSRPEGYWGECQYVTTFVRITRAIRPRATRLRAEASEPTTPPREAARPHPSPR